jgi:cytochrome c-type biogenesis protein CcsB
MTLNIEIAFVWAAVFIYAASAILFGIGTVFGRERLLRIGVWVAALGLTSQAVAFGVRWVRVGHAPFLGFYEVVSAYAFATVAATVIVALWRPQLRPLGSVLMPLSLLALGASMLADKTDEVAGGMLSSWWLTVHVSFAKLSYSSFIVAFALAVVFLMRGRPSPGKLSQILAKLPSQDSVDDLSYRFAAVGLIFQSVMIASGAIWANESWGRYWGWDPIETWSLVTWLVYSAYLHCRLTLGWRGKKSAWFLVAALPVMIFTLLVVPIIYNSIHGAYLRGL